jgi:hypothetical protein
VDYIIVDNFLESPKEIRKKALKNFKYFNKFNHPQDVGMFPGFRTNYLHFEDKELFEKICNKLHFIISKLENIENLGKKYKQFNCQLSFSYTLEDSKTSKHIDPTSFQYLKRYGGVVYLNEKPPKKTGTTLYFKDKNVYVDNIFNRLVLYKSDIEHEPTKNFGNSIKNGRMVLTIFYDLI